MPIINIIFVRDPKQCFALFDPRFARISTYAQDDTDEKRRGKAALHQILYLCFSIFLSSSFFLRGFAFCEGGEDSAEN
jgi:hypothetical protein